MSRSRRLVFGAALVLVVLGSGSGCRRSPPVRELTAGDRQILTAWDQIFTEERVIKLQPPEGGPPLLHVAQVLESSEGNLIIPDARAKRILVFEPDGRLVREIRGGDEGAFELSVLQSIALDPEDNLLVFDPDGLWVTILPNSEDGSLRRFQISASAAVFLALTDGEIVTYSPTDTKVFHKFDRTGRRLASAHRVRDEKLRLFHARVQTGGIAKSTSGDLYGIHPATFELVRLSPDLKVLELLRGPANDPWQPHAPEFPRELSPYDYHPPHEEWWDSFTHIGRIFALEDGLLMVTLFASRGLGEGEEFANIYQMNGRVMAQGLEVPHGGRIAGADGRKIYVVRSARLGATDSLEPLALYAYRTRLQGA